MDYIIVVLPFVALVLFVGIISFITWKVRKSAHEVCLRASDLIADICIMEGDLVDLRQQIMELSDVLDEISEDTAEDDDDEDFLDSEFDTE